MFPDAYTTLSTLLMASSGLSCHSCESSASLSDGRAQLTDELVELGLAAPERMLPVAHLVSHRVGLFAVEVGIELGQQGGHRGGEGLSMVREGERADNLGPDYGPS
ncbi:hypothetical protein ACFVY0_38575 [Streptomyces sp. NPDC058286]|uniref:hypothetical protein n=1 Tax=unclassified Streptomyces TaxID=2593676 RepID=UPI0036F0BC07